MLVTLVEERSIAWRLMQPSKDLAPISVRLLGTLIVTRSVQSISASSGMLVVPPGTVRWPELTDSHQEPGGGGEGDGGGGEGGEGGCGGVEGGGKGGGDGGDGGGGDGGGGDGEEGGWAKV